MLGLEFARGVSAPTDVMLAHALPERVDVVVRDENDQVIARGESLEHPESTPIARLRVGGSSVTRENVWPDDSDIGRLVILPGGEIGTVCEWSHAEDHSSWRWEVEFFRGSSSSRRALRPRATRTLRRRKAADTFAMHRDCMTESAKPSSRAAEPTLAFARLRIELPDHPGALAAVGRVLAGCGLNVVEVAI